MKAVINYIIVISGLLPATVVLAGILFTFPTLLSSFSFRKMDICFLVSYLGGICGYIGLVLILYQLLDSNFLLKIILLGLGLGSFVLFNSVVGSSRAWSWIFFVEEPDEWFLFVWPSIVSLYFILALIWSKSRNWRWTK